jgi:hypothetical protein
MQKSHQGLLRALLFQVLGKHPDLIPVVFPERWKKSYLGCLDLGEQIAPDSWSLRELTTAFTTLVRQNALPIKLCFLIDEFDEFDGEADELCGLFKELGCSDNSKFCVSSRPWMEFQDSFRKCASLRLQDLTFKDIETYVNDKFRRHFERLEAQSADVDSSLVAEIVKRANGVFLWVQIVVKLLLKGLSNRDSIPQLWKRLDSLPRELELLYDHLFSQIEPVYLEWASKAFQIMQLTQSLSSDPFRTLPKPRLRQGSKPKEIPEPGASHH